MKSVNCDRLILNGDIIDGWHLRKAGTKKWQAKHTDFFKVIMKMMENFGTEVIYVRGNHDGNYDRRPPEGCDCIEDKLVVFNGLRIAGLGGSRLYSGGKNQYSEREMKNRIWKLGWKIRRAGGVDIVVAHAPVRGVGDGDDYAHMGFEAFLPLLDRYKPRYFIHGHVHMEYGRDIARMLRRGDTTIINACERYTLEV